MVNRTAAPASEPRRHKPDMLMLFFLAILLLLGLIIIYAISPALAAREGDISQNAYMYRQLMYLAFGLAAFTVAAYTPLAFWRQIQGKLLIGALILGTLPFMLQLTPIGLCTNDACRWIDLGVLTFQPAEVMKLALVVFLAGFLAVRTQQGQLNDVKNTLIPIGVLLGITAIIVVVLQRDLGTGITVFGIALTMLFVAGMRTRLLLASIGVILAAGILFIATAPHRVERVLTFVGHESVETDEMGYHIHQALIAIGSGGATGKGLGQSVQAFGYLPEASNDSIFAILAEKFGFLGTIAVLAVFAALFWRILAIMNHTVDVRLRLIVAGILGWIFSHAVVNIGAMLGIFPLTGITLPFVSLGGTSLLLMLCALGMVYAISRYATHRLPESDNYKTGGTSNDYRRSGRRIGRSRDAGGSRASRIKTP